MSGWNAVPFTPRYPGKCRHCGEPFAAGEHCYRFTSFRSMICHAACIDALDQELCDIDDELREERGE